MKRLVISEAARSDLASIADYTQTAWGRAQKSRYLAILENGFSKIRQRPALGRLRDDVRQGCRSFACGRHVVFYRETGGAVEIVRVLRQTMDVHSRLENDQR